MVPRNWHDQYELTVGSVLQSVHKLLKALERIKKAYSTEKECKGPKANTTGGGSFEKRMVTFSNRIPKKSCKKHGARITPITRVTARNTIRKVLQKRLHREECTAHFTQQTCITRAEHKLCTVV